MNLTDAFYQTVHDAPGGCEALAVRLGMSAQILRNKANPNVTANKPMLDDADRIMTLTGDHRILHALANSQGHVCVRIEEDGSASDVAILDAMTQIWAANGEIGTEVMRALDDGRIDQQEVVRIRAAIHKTERAMHQMLARVNSLAK